MNVTAPRHVSTLVRHAGGTYGPLDLLPAKHALSSGLPCMHLLPHSLVCKAISTGLVSAGRSQAVVPMHSGEFVREA